MTANTKSLDPDLSRLSSFALTQELKGERVRLKNLQDASPVLELDVLKARKRCDLLRAEIDRRDGLREPMSNAGFSDLPDECGTDD